MSDLKLMKEIDEFVNEEDREQLGHEEHLQKLLLCLDKAQRIHHPVAKKKVTSIYLSIHLSILLFLEKVCLGSGLWGRESWVAGPSCTGTLPLCVVYIKAQQVHFLRQ